MGAYYWWLVNKISKANTDQYNTLLELLYSREFHSTMKGDINRVYDGLDLRMHFEDQTGYPASDLGENCSVLEVMVGLAIRCEDVIWNGKGVPYWFWQMIDSMCLTRCTDDNFDIIFANRCIDRMLNREYGHAGVGSLFSVRGPRRMDELDLWGQMQAYLNEVF